MGTKESIKEFEKAVEDLNKSLEIASIEAFEDVAWKIGEIAQNKVPIDTGYLRQSYTVLKIKNQVSSGYNTEYAYRIHEGINKKGGEIKLKSGEKKFFETTITKNKENIIKFFNLRVTKHLSKK